MRLRSLPWTVLLVFLAITLLLAWTESYPTFPDPDAFYHAKMALIVRDQGFIDTFPWLHYTVLRDHYVDHHLLYHIILVPFVTLFDPLVGMKVSAVVFGVIAFYALYRFLRFLQAPRPEILTLIAALSTGFFFRMSLPRAPSLSVALTLLGAWAMLKQNTWMVALTGFLFVWFYNGWPILLAVLFAVYVATVVSEHLTAPGSLWTHLRVGARRCLPSAYGLALGVTIGLLTHPNFPDNITFSILHIIEIGIVNYQTVIPVGREWSPVTFPELIQQNIPAFLTFFLALVVLFPSLARHRTIPSRDQLIRTFTCVFLACGFLMLTLKSIRYTEYSIPTLILAAGALLSHSTSFLTNTLLPDIRSRIETRWWKQTLVAACLALWIIISAYENVTLRAEKEYYRPEQYTLATDWIQEHVPPEEVIFHNGWDYSLILFYLDDTHRYLVGLDPTFMYKPYPEEFTLWHDLIRGNRTDVEQIVETFGAKTVVVDTRIDSEAFQKNLVAHNLFEQVAQNEWIHVYHYVGSPDTSNAQ